MSPTDLIKKLGLKPAQNALVLNSPAGYLERLGELPDGIRISQQVEGKPHGEYDFVQLFVRDNAEFDAQNQVQLTTIYEELNGHELVLMTL